MASLQELSPHDRQIMALNRRTTRLDYDRLRTFREEIVHSYEAATIIGQTGRVAEVLGRVPISFTIIRKTETHSLADFNDQGFYWDLYCQDLGRAVALGEELYLFESLVEGVGVSSTPIGSQDPDFGVLFEHVDELRAEGHKPDVICAPISMMVPFLTKLHSRMRWSHPREILLEPSGDILRVFWSSKNRPLDRFLVFDSSAALWSVRPDPESGHWLTVAIGESEGESDSVVWFAETILKYEITDSSAFRSILLKAAEHVEEGE